MLDDFKESEFYQYAVSLKKIYHAYLFEVDNVERQFPLILAFAKMLICKNHYINNHYCNDCNICYLIDKNNYPDLKIISPDGLSIKKEQILSLKQDFSKHSFNDNNLIYIIKEADKMNLSAANSILKFLEEPNDNIYAILVTTNCNKILETIISRCNLFVLKDSENINYDIDNIKKNIEFIKLFHKEKENTIAYLNKYWFSFNQTKEEFVKNYDMLEIIFDYAIYSKFDIDCSNSNIYDIIKQSFIDIDLGDIIQYANIVSNYKSKLIDVLNINLNLFMDHFIIEISKVR